MTIGRRTVIAMLAAGTAVSVGVLPAAGSTNGHKGDVFTIFQHDTDQQNLDFGAPAPASAISTSSAATSSIAKAAPNSVA